MPYLRKQVNFTEREQRVLSQLLEELNSDPFWSGNNFKDREDLKSFHRIIKKIKKAETVYITSFK